MLSVLFLLYFSVGYGALGSNSVPSLFDSRAKWPDCTTISEVRTMDPNCPLSNWAFALTSTMSDRICIEYNRQVVLSPYNLQACCLDCSNGVCGSVNSVFRAWNHYIQIGICTGDDSNNGCQPFQSTSDLSSCSNKCTNSNYGVDYDKDLNFGKSAYSIAPGVTNIQVEISTNGPVMALMDRYSDFDSITNNVYAPSPDAILIDVIAVKIIGWGTDPVPFWLATYFNGIEWGDKGFFRIYRGNNICQIETNVIAGTSLNPNLTDPYNIII